MWSMRLWETLVRVTFGTFVGGLVLLLSLPYGWSKVDVGRAGARGPTPALVTELMPLGSFATWQAERAIADHDRSTLRLRLDPQGDQAGLEPGMTVWPN